MAEGGTSMAAASSAAGEIWPELRYDRPRTYVVCFPRRRDEVCRRQNFEDARALLALCRQHAAMPLPDLKRLCKGKGKRRNNSDTGNNMAILTII